MSNKNTSTITNKPTVSDINAWIGATTDGAETAPQIAGHHVDMPTSKHADKKTNTENTLMLSARIPASLVRELRICAATEDRPIQEIVAQIVKEYLEAHKV